MVVCARFSITGLIAPCSLADARAEERAGGGGSSTLAVARTSLPLWRSAPPSVAHLRIVWIRWFGFNGFDKYSYGALALHRHRLLGLVTYIHLCLNAFLAVTNHGMCGKGDDWRSGQLVVPFPLADLARSFETTLRKCQ